MQEIESLFTPIFQQYIERYEHTELSHGRIETRVCELIAEPLSLEDNPILERWAGLNSVLPPELIKNSTFSMVLLALTNSLHRTKYISEKELDAKLVDSLGPNWRDFLYEYKEKLKSPSQTTQEID